MEELRRTKAYRYIEPGPVLLMSTAGADGVPNLMAMRCHMVIEDGGRPRIGCMLGPGTSASARCAIRGNACWPCPRPTLPRQLWTSATAPARTPTSSRRSG